MSLRQTTACKEHRDNSPPTCWLWSGYSHIQLDRSFNLARGLNYTDQNMQVKGHNDTSYFCESNEGKNVKERSVCDCTWQRL